MQFLQDFEKKKVNKKQFNMEIYSWTLTLRIFYCSICFIYQNNIHVIYMHAMLFNDAHLRV